MTPEITIDPNPDSEPHFTLPPETAATDPWEEIAPGRFMPRRVRGSCKGRALG